MVLIWLEDDRQIDAACRYPYERDRKRVNGVRASVGQKKVMGFDSLTVARLDSPNPCLTGSLDFNRVKVDGGCSAVPATFLREGCRYRDTKA